MFLWWDHDCDALIWGIWIDFLFLWFLQKWEWKALTCSYLRYRRLITKTQIILGGNLRCEHYIVVLHIYYSKFYLISTEMIHIPSGWLLLQYMTSIYCAWRGFRFSEKEEDVKQEWREAWLMLKSLPAVPRRWHKTKCARSFAQITISVSSLPAGQINYLRISLSRSGCARKKILPWRACCGHERGMRGGTKVKRCPYVPIVNKPDRYPG